MYTVSPEARTSLETARDLHELRHTVATLHRRFPWQQKWEELLALNDRFRNTAPPQECPEYWLSTAMGRKATSRILLDPIPLWPADRAFPVQRYVARRLRHHGDLQLRCIVYSSSTGIPLWQLLAQRAFVLLDSVHARATGSGERRPYQILANKALALSKHWEKSASHNPSALWAARSIYAHLLDAPPVDTWQNYYSTMIGSIERLRSFLYEVSSQDRPVALLLPFSLEPYAVTLLEAPDYPANLLLANVFPHSPLTMDTAHPVIEWSESAGYMAPLPAAHAA
jgi:hypothetical protein